MVGKILADVTIIESELNSLAFWVTDLLVFSPSYVFTVYPAFNVIDNKREVKTAY